MTEDELLKKLNDTIETLRDLLPDERERIIRTVMVFFGIR